MGRVAILFLVLILLVPAPGRAGDVEVLDPGPRFRDGKDTAWLVVRALEEPAVLLDGAPVAPVVAEAGVFHYPLRSVSGADASLSIAGSPGFGLHAQGAGETGFHTAVAAACWDCHDAGDAGCMECHDQWGDGKHQSVLAEGCVGCHVHPDRSPGEVGALCVGCHAEYASGRHGRIRHAVSSDRDPSRPGRKMDCASCHDPHVPACLGCLDRSELRAWCKRCHSGP